MYMDMVSYPYTPGPSGYDSAPTPSSSNHFPSTPAASGAAARSSAGGAGGQGVATPATGAAGGGSSSSSSSRNVAQTPGANAAPQTPAGASATPMTPASHFPQTPFMPTGGDYSGMDHHHHGEGGASGGGGGGSQSSMSNGDRVATDIEVKVTGGASFEEGKYSEMVGRMIRVPGRSALSVSAKCDVRLTTGGEEGKVVSVPIQHLEAVKPVKNDQVKVLTGQHRGNLGTLMGVDGEDAIVCFRGENMYNVLTMPALGKYLGQ